MAYGKKLTDTEIAGRLTRLRNLEQLHKRDRRQIAEFKQRVRTLEREKADDRAYFKELFQKQQVRIAELEKMVFGSRPTAVPPQPPDTSSQGGATPPKPSRQAASFRRPVPDEQAITAITSHPVSACSSCGGPLSRIRDHVHYVEDIVLPVLDGGRTKTATRQLVQSGWCASCQQTTYGDSIDLRGQQVVLGSSVRLLTIYFLTVLDMTYSQMVTVFRDLYGLAVSEGELAAIARKHGAALLPEKEDIARSIREGPGEHLDETSYRIFSQGMGWAWCMGSTANEDVIYEITESRGKDHVKELLGTDTASIHVHDCYGAYKQLDTLGPGQTCWSHYYRVVRDLADLDAEILGGKATKEHCIAAKVELGSIYADLRQCLAGPFEPGQREEQQVLLQARIDWFCVPHQDDPKKLKDLKRRLQDWRHTLLTCLLYEDIPADNNKAERHLRKLVLKREKSFGVRNMHTANTLSVLMSVVWTYKHRTQATPGALLPALAELVRG